jgi:thiamine transport system permease protein
VWADPDTWLALRNTLQFTGMALVLATVLGLLQALAGYALRPWPRWALAWRASAYAPLVVSPVALAFGLLLLYPQWLASLPLLVAAYALLAYPFVAKALTAALDAMPEHYAQAAATLGARPLQVFWRVTLPLVASALRRGVAFAAATMLGEFAVSLLLSRPEWLTLTTLIYQRLGRPGSANLDAALVLSASLMLLALLVFMAIEGRPDRVASQARRTGTAASATNPLA